MGLGHTNFLDLANSPIATSNLSLWEFENREGKEISEKSTLF